MATKANPGKFDCSAEISPCGLYRWWLQRRWADGPIVCFTMLNPSTADAEQDDPTIRRCIAFAQAWGFGALSVRNLFPFRATDPDELRRAVVRGVDIRGGQRGESELAAAGTADLIVAAWGSYRCETAADRFCRLTDPCPLWCIDVTRKGCPVHPLYQSAQKRPKPFLRCEGRTWQEALPCK